MRGFCIIWSEYALCIEIFLCVLQYIQLVMRNTIFLCVTQVTSSVSVIRLFLSFLTLSAKLINSKNNVPLGK